MILFKKLFMFIFLVNCSFLCNAITTDLCLKAYKAYSPYKESFPYFWRSLTHEQKILLKKELTDHSTVYIESKRKNASLLKRKKIASGSIKAVIISPVCILAGTLLIIMLKDFTSLSQTMRASIATLIACGTCTNFIAGLSRIIKGLFYIKRLENRNNRDQILLQAIGTYEQEFI